MAGGKVKGLEQFLEAKRWWIGWGTAGALLGDGATMPHLEGPHATSVGKVNGSVSFAQQNHLILFLLRGD